MSAGLPRSTAAQRRSLRLLVRESCENRPGVYRIFGNTGIVLYVGKSRRLRTRLLSYFRARGRRNKAARILRHAFSIEWEYTPTEFSALLAELRLIKRHRPTFNSTYIDDEWPRAWIALTSGPVPALRIVPRTDDPRAALLFGPFRHVSRVREAVRALADVMFVRDCPIDDAPVGSGASLSFSTDSGVAIVPAARTRASKARTRAPGCLRYEIGTCPGPCIGLGDRAEYLRAVDEIGRFLQGASELPITLLQSAMEQASARMEFERAALLRDRLALVRWLGGRVRQFRADADRLSFRYHARAFDGGEHVYFIRRGTLRAEIGAQATDAERAELDVMSARIYDGPDPSGADIPLHDLDEFHLVASWFRRNPAELERTVSPRRP